MATKQYKYHCPTSVEQVKLIDPQVNKETRAEIDRDHQPNGGGGENNGKPPWGDGGYVRNLD